MGSQSVCLYCIIQTTLLLLVANGAPVLIDKALAERGAWPVDSGLKFNDGYRLFGGSKTWRGICAAVLLTSVSALLIGINPLTGAEFGALAMVGDLLASFIKRRLAYAESSQAMGLDTLPESLLPAWLLTEPLSLSGLDLVLIIVIFFLIDWLLSPFLYRWHIRKRPY